MSKATQANKQNVTALANMLEHSRAALVQTKVAEIDQIQEDIRNFQQAYVQNAQNLRILTLELEGLQRGLKEHEEKVSQFYDTVMGMEKVKGIEIDGFNIQIFTNTLYATDPDTQQKYEIGEMVLSIMLREGRLNIKNETRKVDGYWPKSNAVHVDDDGTPRLDNSAEIVTQLFIDYDYVGLVNYAISVVEGVNKEDVAGEYIDRWPLA